MISAVILTKNEEKNIEECIKGLSWCDDIVVVDDNSTDRTVLIAKKFGVNIFINSLDNDFSKQRNFGLSKTKNDWVLFIDADERVSDSLAYEISNNVNNFLQYTAFALKRIDFIWGKKLKHGETGNIKIIRLVKKNYGKWEGLVHEKWKTSGQIGKLNNSLLHYPHRPVNEFLQEINFYTDLRAKELFEKSIHVYWPSIILYPSGKFLLNYFLKLGFFDGIPGLIMTIIMSFHSFLVRGKLWLLWQAKKHEDS